MTEPDFGDVVGSLEINMSAIRFEDGQISAGLAAVREATLETSKRIPVPLNVFMAKTPVDILKISKWAHDKTEGNLEKIGNQLAYWFGAVDVKNPPEYGRLYTKEELERLDWDTEVRIIEEEVPNLNNDQPGEDSLNKWITWKMSEATKVMGLIFAGKLTWWICQHHLGTNIQQRTTSGEANREEDATVAERRYQPPKSGRSRYGYLEKMVIALNLDKEGYGFRTEAHISKLYTLIHPWSTRWVIAYLYKAKWPKRNCPVIRVYPIAPNAKWMQAALEEDLLMRVGAIGAGYAKLGDLFQAFRLLSGTPIIGAAPGIADAGRLLRDYEKVMKEPFMYGINAPYLCGSEHPTHWNEGPTQLLMASLATYMTRRSEDSSLSHAALFCKPISDFEGYTPRWDNFVRAYEEASTRYLPDSAEFMQKLVAISGGVQGQALSPETLKAMADLGITVDITAIEAANKLLDEAARQRAALAEPAKAPISPSFASVVASRSDITQPPGGAQ